MLNNKFEGYDHLQPDPEFKDRVMQKINEEPKETKPVFTFKKLVVGLSIVVALVVIVQGIVPLLNPKHNEVFIQKPIPGMIDPKPVTPDPKSTDYEPTKITTLAFEFPDASTYLDEEGQYKLGRIYSGAGGGAELPSSFKEDDGRQLRLYYKQILSVEQMIELAKFYNNTFDMDINFDLMDTSENAKMKHVHGDETYFTINNSGSVQSIDIQK